MQLQNLYKVSILSFFVSSPAIVQFRPVFENVVLHHLHSFPKHHHGPHGATFRYAFATVCVTCMHTLNLSEVRMLIRG